MRETDVLFEAILIPHRSLPPVGVIAVMCALIVVSAAIGVGFTLVGAWPVLGFLGIDIILVYWAFRISYGAARQSEHVRLSADELEIVFMDASGADRRATVQSYWATAWLEPANTKQDRLVIRSHGRELELGSFLGRAEKIAFADRLNDALRKSRDSVPEHSFEP